jgi:hypothetical protein
MPGKGSPIEPAMIAQKRDANEQELAMIAQQLGAMVIYQDRKAGFDLLLVTPYGNHIVEIKNPDLVDWWLTTNEAITRKAIEQAGAAYYIVETWQEMLGLVRNDQDVIKRLLSKGDRKNANS